MYAPAGRLFRWLNHEHGFPLSFYDEKTRRINRGYRGFITHRSLIQRVQHHNYITHAQWSRILAGAPSPTDPVSPISPNQEDDMLLTVTDANKSTLFTGSRWTNISGEQAYALALQKVPHLTGLNGLVVLKIAKDLAPEQFAETFDR